MYKIMSNVKYIMYKGGYLIKKQIDDNEFNKYKPTNITSLYKIDTKKVINEDGTINEEKLLEWFNFYSRTFTLDDAFDFLISYYNPLNNLHKTLGNRNYVIIDKHNNLIKKNTYAVESAGQKIRERHKYNIYTLEDNYTLSMTSSRVDPINVPDYEMDVKNILVDGICKLTETINKYIIDALLLDSNSFNFIPFILKFNECDPYVKSFNNKYFNEINELTTRSNAIKIAVESGCTPLMKLLMDASTNIFVEKLVVQSDREFSKNLSDVVQTIKGKLTNSDDFFDNLYDLENRDDFGNGNDFTKLFFTIIHHHTRESYKKIAHHMCITDINNEFTNLNGITTFTVIKDLLTNIYDVNKNELLELNSIVEKLDNPRKILEKDIESIKPLFTDNQFKGLKNLYKKLGDYAFDINSNIIQLFKLCIVCNLYYGPHNDIIDQVFDGDYIKLNDGNNLAKDIIGKLSVMIGTRGTMTETGMVGQKTNIQNIQEDPSIASELIQYFMSNVHYCVELHTKILSFINEYLDEIINDNQKIENLINITKEKKCYLVKNSNVLLFCDEIKHIIIDNLGITLKMNKYNSIYETLIRHKKTFNLIEYIKKLASFDTVLNYGITGKKERENYRNGLSIIIRRINSHINIPLHHYVIDYIGHLIEELYFVSKVNRYFKNSQLSDYFVGNTIQFIYLCRLLNTDLEYCNKRKILEGLLNTNTIRNINPAILNPTSQTKLEIDLFHFLNKTYNSVKYKAVYGIVPDCMESTIRDFINILLLDKKNNLDISNLPGSTIEPIRVFYEKYHNIIMHYDSANNDIRKDWLQIFNTTIKSILVKKYPSISINEFFHNDRQHAHQDMRSTYINFIDVLCAMFNFADILPRDTSTDTENKCRNIITHIASLFPNKQTTVTFYLIKNNWRNSMEIIINNQYIISANKGHSFMVEHNQSTVTLPNLKKSIININNKFDYVSVSLLDSTGQLLSIFYDFNNVVDHISNSLLGENPIGIASDPDILDNIDIISDVIISANTGDLFVSMLIDRYSNDYSTVYRVLNLFPKICRILTNTKHSELFDFNKFDGTNTIFYMLQLILKIYNLTADKNKKNIFIQLLIETNKANLECFIYYLLIFKHDNLANQLYKDILKILESYSIIPYNFKLSKIFLNNFFITKIHNKTYEEILPNIFNIFENLQHDYIIEDIIEILDTKIAKGKISKCVAGYKNIEFCDANTTNIQNVLNMFRNIKDIKDNKVTNATVLEFIYLLQFNGLIDLDENILYKNSILKYFIFNAAPYSIIKMLTYIPSTKNELANISNNLLLPPHKYQNINTIVASYISIMSEYNLNSLTRLFRKDKYKYDLETIKILLEFTKGLDIYLNSQQIGGNINYKKYIEYKRKYLLLKNKLNN